MLNSFPSVEKTREVDFWYLIEHLKEQGEHYIKEFNKGKVYMNLIQQVVVFSMNCGVVKTLEYYSLLLIK